MDDLAKLRHLIEHWQEHNEGHIKTYSEWAEKASRMGRPDLEEALREVVGATGELGRKLKKAGETAKA